MSQCQYNIDPARILEVVSEVEEKIRQKNTSPQDRVLLFQQLESLHELLGESEQQKSACYQAQKLALETQ